jgi:arylsulfatase A
MKLLSALLFISQIVYAVPNFIIIMADDLGIGEINQQNLEYGFFAKNLSKSVTKSTYNIKTPNIELLSKNGIIYNKVWSAAVCAPSRMMLCTGIDTPFSSVKGNYDSESGLGIIPNNTMLSNIQRLGYVTVISGKYGLGRYDSAMSVKNMGFNYSMVYETHKDAHFPFPISMVENGIIRKWDVNKYANYRRCLRNKCVSGDDKSLEYTLQSIDRFTTEQTPFLIFDMPLYNHVGKFYNTKGYNYGYPVNSYGSSLRRWNKDAKGYASMIEKFDNRVGSIHNKLENLGILDNTVIIITSDNGAECYYNKGKPKCRSDPFKSSGYRRGKKRSLFEGGINVPMIVYNGVKNGKHTERSNVPFTLAGVLPSIIDMIKKDKGDFIPISRDDYLINEYCETKEQICKYTILNIKTNYKMIFDEVYYLFDLTNDPTESSSINNITIIKEMDAKFNELKNNS